MKTKRQLKSEACLHRDWDVVNVERVTIHEGGATCAYPKEVEVSTLQCGHCPYIFVIREKHW